MAFPFDLLTNPWVDGEGLNASKLFSRITDNLNKIAAALPLGYINDAQGGNGTNVTFTTTSAFAGGAPVTFTLTSQRRVKITTIARYQLGSATAGRMTMIAGYNTGSSAVIGSFVNGTSTSTFVYADTTGANGTNSGISVATVLLPAGTYTAYASVTRLNGATSDVAGSFYTLVEDVGSI